MVHKSMKTLHEILKNEIGYTNMSEEPELRSSLISDHIEFLKYSIKIKQENEFIQHNLQSLIGLHFSEKKKNLENIFFM